MIFQKGTKPKCPDCGAALSSEGWCFQCGYRGSELVEKKRGFAYSKQAHFALGVAQFVSILSCIGSVVAGVVLASMRQYGPMIGCFFGFFYSFAMWVVFKRAENIPPPKN